MAWLDAHPHQSTEAIMLAVCPISVRDALEYVRRHHRRLGAPAGYKFSVAVEDPFGMLRGVLIASRPVARAFDDNRTLEVTRVATDGTRNACSMLYAAAWRIARGMGYARLITYTALDEPGTSLRAAGWRTDALIHGHSWNSRVRRRTDKHTVEDRQRWILGKSPDTPRMTAHECMALGARLTHEIRTGRSETAIRDEITRRRRLRQRVNKAAVARAVGMSREQLSRRYGHLFP